MIADNRPRDAGWLVAPCCIIGCMTRKSETSGRREERVAVQFRILPVLLVRLDDCTRRTGFRRTEAIRAAIANWCEQVEETDARRRQTVTRRQSGPEDDLA